MNNIDIEKHLATILSESASAPFLFIGSGFSRRYINMPDWVGLLQNFSNKPFASYLGKANGDIPTAALSLAEDYYDAWWNINVDRRDVYESENWSDKVETPLKYEISSYLQEYTISEDIFKNSELTELVSDKVVIDGIITTNWDLLLDKLFPHLKVYIGQSDILFKHPQAIGEIYKIHGCCTKYNSLVLSSNDYRDFNDKNPYLASKLISIFLEKPVIFIGYSIRDKNITDLLEKIESVIDSKEKILKLSKNMIFVTRANGKNDEVSLVDKLINDKRLTFTNIQTDDFGKVYKALQYAERKIPVDFLRVFKEQIYNIVNSKDKADLRLKHVDFDNAIENDEIEFIAGVGVLSMSDFGKKGLSGIEVKDLIEDIIFNNLGISNEDIISILPNLIKGTPTYIPIRKYLVSNYNILDDSEEFVRKRLSIISSKYIKKIINSRTLSKSLKDVTNFEEILNREDFTLNKKLDALSVWLYDNKSIENCQAIKLKLKENYTTWKIDATYINLKRLVCLLDEIENNDLETDP